MTKRGVEGGERVDRGVGGEPEEGLGDAGLGLGADRGREGDAAREQAGEQGPRGRARRLGAAALEGAEGVAEGGLRVLGGEVGAAGQLGEAVGEGGPPLVGGGEGDRVDEARQIVAARERGDLVEHGLG